ncbi:MAG: triple tyrosine motif-containing protein [Bacteroidota bacterium]|nr:triple tyrosine motif-containing protein [Bacteroidota bacterium]
MALFVISLFSASEGEAQEIGTPFIRNFSKADYRASTQNWAVAQDARGFMYFANNDGLLVYDGVQWHLFPMPNLSMVRSIHIDDRNNIYIGAYNDLGRMVAEPNGKLSFRSLRDSIPYEFRNFDDVWNIFTFRDRTMFQSYNAAYFYREGSPMTVVAAPSRFQNSYLVRGRLIFNDTENGLMEFDGTRLVGLRGCEALAGEDIWSVLPFGQGSEILICTLRNGLFVYDGYKLKKWDIPVNRTLIRDRVFSATVLHDGHYAIGTILNGVMILDSEGNIIQHINRKKGLQNNTVLDLFTDRAGNLWLALNNGIDYLVVNSPLTFIRSYEGFGAGYTSLIHKGKLYLGTNQGLYVKEWPEREAGSDFRIIPGTSGQVWYLGIHNGVILCGHDEGTFRIQGEEATLISDVSGGWKYMELKRHPGYLIGGTYSGIILFRWEQGTWKFVRQLAGINESFRVFEEDRNGDIWMSHGFKGIFRVTVSDGLDSVTGVRYYNSSNGLPSDFYLNIVRVRGQLVVVSETEIYEYSPAEDRFIKSVYFNQLLSPVVAISYLFEDTGGNIWYVAKNMAGVFRLKEDHSYENITTPFLLLAGRFIHGFETFYPYSPEDVIIGTEDGFAHYSSRTAGQGYEGFSVYITKGEALHQDSVFYYGRTFLSQGEESSYRFRYAHNDLRFTYASPVYDNAGNTEYSYRLSGYEDEWSDWSRASVKEYSNLPDGRFSFEVKARNQLGIESAPDSVEFVIGHPWYKSPVAYISYILASSGLVILLIRFISWRIELSKKKNQRIYEAKEQEYKRQALESEKEIIRIRNEKLQAEMILRDKELANEAMNLVRKNEFLNEIRDNLNYLRDGCRDEETTLRVNEILTRIGREVDSNRQREVFENAFDEVHEEFLQRVKSRYPQLTPAELRLCAYLKMNLPTKEIAPLLNISVRGVEIGRYRIRKKMGISRNVNLTTHLLNI